MLVRELIAYHRNRARISHLSRGRSVETDQTQAAHRRFSLHKQGLATLVCVLWLEATVGLLTWAGVLLLVDAYSREAIKAAGQDEEKK